MSNLIGSTVSNISQSAAINNALLFQKDTSTEKSSSESIGSVSVKKDNKTNSTNATTQVNITNVQGIAHQLALYNNQGIVPATSANKVDNVAITSSNSVSKKGDYTVNANSSFVTAKTKWAKYTTASSSDKVAVNSNSASSISTSWSVDSSQSKNDNKVPNSFVAGIKTTTEADKSKDVSSQVAGASNKVETNSQTHTSWGLFVEGNKESNNTNTNASKVDGSQKQAETTSQVASAPTKANSVMKGVFLKALANKAAQKDQMDKASFQNFQSTNLQSEQTTEAYFANSNNTKQAQDTLTTQDYFSKKLNLTNLYQANNTPDKNQVQNASNLNASQSIARNDTNIKVQANYRSDAYYKEQPVLASKQETKDNSQQENDTIQEKKVNTNKELNQFVASSNSRPGNNASAILLNNFLYKDLS